MLNMRFSLRARLSLSSQALLALIPLLLFGPVAFLPVSADSGHTGSGFKPTGQQSKLIASISFEGIGLGMNCWLQGSGQYRLTDRM
jgi:hypothetical protein